MAVMRIIFLCRDNGALSPMAESIFLSLYRGKPIYVASRGLVVLFETPFNPKMETVLASHNLKPVREHTLGLEKEELTGDTLVIAMNKRAAEQFRRIYPDVKCRTLAELSGEEGDCRDPYGGTVMDYEECFNEIGRRIRKLLPKLSEMAAARETELEEYPELFERERTKKKDKQ